MPPEPPPPPTEIDPDRPIEDRRSGLLRHEAGLIGALLAILVGTQAYQQWIPNQPSQEISIARGESSSQLPAIDWDASPPEPRITAHDLNTATRADLMRVPGIGPALAEQIVRHREEHGPFATFQSLDEVPGIGPKKLESFSAYLYVAGQPAGQIQPAIGGALPKPAKINLNTATQAELESLPGIGKVYAENILRRRQEVGKFRGWNDLLAVPGIGAKRLENIKQNATIH